MIKHPELQGLAALLATGSVVYCRQLLLAAACARGADTWGPRWLALGLSNSLREIARLVGVNFETDTEEKWQHDPEKRLDPERQYLTCWHPHGALTFCAAMFTSGMAARSTLPAAPGPRNWFVGIATLLFRFPFIGEYLALVNARPVTQRMSDKLLAAGRSMALQPGGLPEQVVTDHRKEQLVFPPGLGFCRLALKHGTPLLPIYVFGENQVFTTYEWGRRTTQSLFRRFGIAVPLINPWPNNLTLHMKWGRPVEVPGPKEDLEDADVERVFAQYLLALAELFQQHAATCLPPEVAREGLHVVWRGHSKAQLDKLLAAETAEWPPCLRTGEGVAAPRSRL
mmetsp:Transcript_8219/g.19583  ORF Transcript_8219/g.19583 Transcript_8219/m.19583 type:complete len:340 (-) Transcript_8219:137-1156(-)|eukprot:CAMPEP_0181520204 /NCGR_PEP_ID=MMETSP1110-20121109/66186_1 /TAXON_ID=174948 /ORGANISM="Symbiodinium sp., Strain CCMP421" /LENGTH=339 /DNA_ID=CAMNT_0023650679 /DNA_START=45 /DNA_END=1064 /DNA_ORIENTATION=-